jgi:hypothetical protein
MMSEIRFEETSEAVVPGKNFIARYSHGWRALRHRNFRLFFAGQSVSLIGTWMTRVATGWLVYKITGPRGISALLVLRDRSRRS